MNFWEIGEQQRKVDCAFALSLARKSPLPSRPGRVRFELPPGASDSAQALPQFLIKTVRRLYMLRLWLLLRLWLCLLLDLRLEIRVLSVILYVVDQFARRLFALLFFLVSQGFLYRAVSRPASSADSVSFAGLGSPDCDVPDNYWIRLRRGFDQLIGSFAQTIGAQIQTCFPLPSGARSRAPSVS